MNIKKTIWVPFLIGIITGLLVIIADVVGFRIPSGYHEELVDSREIFYSLCAALAGPLGTIFAQVAGFLLNPTLLGLIDPSAIIINFLIHCMMGLWAVFAYRFIHERLNSQMLKVLVWLGTMLVYYTIYTIPVFMLFLTNRPAADFIKEFVVFVRSIFSEFVVTTLLTTLILFFALSKKFRKPLWYEPRGTSY